MNAPMSELLKNFLQAWICWVGATTGHPAFDGGRGLCDSLRYWLDINGYSASAIGMMQDELGEAFIASGLDPRYPFNDRRAFARHQHNGTLHTCPHRLACVRAQLNPYTNTTREYDE